MITPEQNAAADQYLQSTGYTPPAQASAPANDWYSSMMEKTSGYTPPAQPAQQPKMPGFLSNLGSEVGKIPENIASRSVAGVNPVINTLGTAADIAAAPFSAAGKTIAQGAAPGINKVLENMPNITSPDQGGSLLTSGKPNGGYGMSSAEQQIKSPEQVRAAIQDWVKNNPNQAEAARAVTSIIGSYLGAKGLTDVAGELSKAIPEINALPEFGGAPEQAAKIAQQKELESLAQETMGVADKKGRISALEQTGALDKEGNPIGGAKQTLMGGIQLETTPADLERAKAVQGIVKPGVSPVDNLTNLNKEISRISEEEITPALKAAGATTPISENTPGWNSIVQRLANIEKPDIIKADSTLNKTYELVRNRMIDEIKKQPPTVEGLWDARKSFDQVVKNQFGDVAFDSEKNTAIKRAITDMRRTVNTIIGERVPSFKLQMEKLSNLYDARYNIAEQFQGLVNKGGIKAFVALNPKKAALLKWGGGVLGYEGVKHTIAPFLPGI